MRTATLGRDGPRISRLGIGGWQAGGTGPWGAGPEGDEDEAIAAIRSAVEGGVTWVDTAAAYGLGRSEEVVARALAPWRVGEEILVFSKCAHPWELPDRIWTDLSPSTIRRQCEESLRRLSVERIDLYQFHHPDPATPVEDSWATLAALVDHSGQTLSLTDLRTHYACSRPGETVLVNARVAHRSPEVTAAVAAI